MADKLIECSAALACLWGSSLKGTTLCLIYPEWCILVASLVKNRHACLIVLQILKVCLNIYIYNI